MSETVCWHRKFEDSPCPNPPRWRSPDHLCVGDGASFMRAVRWCDEHRHEDDVPIEDPPLPDHSGTEEERAA